VPSPSSTLFFFSKIDFLLIPPIFRGIHCGLADSLFALRLRIVKPFSVRVDNLGPLFPATAAFTVNFPSIFSGRVGFNDVISFSS